MRSSKKVLSLLSKVEKQGYPGFGGRMNAVQTVEFLIRKADYFQKLAEFNAKTIADLKDNAVILDEMLQDLMKSNQKLEKDYSEMVDVKEYWREGFYVAQEYIEKVLKSKKVGG